MTVAVVLAGGLGTRLRSAVADLPKPMANVSDRPFLEYLLDYWIGQGVSRIILSVGYKREMIVQHFGEQYRGVPITYVEEDTPLGTGGGLVLASRRLIEPFLLINGDTYFEASLQEIKIAHLKNGARLTIGLFRANESGRYGGVDLDDYGWIKALKSAKGEAGALANGGVYFIEPNMINGGQFIPGEKYSLEDQIIGQIIEAGFPILGLEQNGKFLDIGIPADYFAAEQFLTK